MVGSTLRRWRLASGLTQKDLQALTGLEQSYISYVEADEYRDIGFKKVAAIVKALKRSLDDLAEEALQESSDKDDEAAWRRPVLALVVGG